MISVFAIAIEVTLILLIVGLCMSMLNDSADRQKGIGFDVMVSPPGSSFSDRHYRRSRLHESC